MRCNGNSRFSSPVTVHFWISLSILTTLLTFSGCSGTELHSGKNVVAVLGEPASLTFQFRFEESIMKQRSIDIVRYDDNNTPVLVLKKHMLVGADKPECTLEKGYESDCKIHGDSLTISIPKVTREHAGVYKSTRHSGMRKHCKLYVLGNEVTCDGSTVSEGNNATVTCQFNGDLSRAGLDFHITRSVDGNQEDVLICNKNGDNIHDCMGYPGKPGEYLFDVENVGSSFTLNLSNVYEKDAGEYTCKIVLDKKGFTSFPCAVQVLANSGGQNIRLIQGVKPVEHGLFETTDSTPQHGESTDTTFVYEAAENLSAFVTGKRKRPWFFAAFVVCKSNRRRLYSDIEWFMSGVWTLLCIITRKLTGIIINPLLRK